MAEETAVAAPSAAAETPKFTQFDGWDEDGTPVVTKKQARQEKQDGPGGAEAAAANAEETTDDGPEAESGKKATQDKSTQETRRKPDAEARIRELAAKAKRLEAELEEARKPKETKTAEPSPARSETKPAETKAAEPAPTRPKPKLNDKGPDGKPLYANYEEHQEALTDWAVEQKLAKREREQQITQQTQRWQQQFSEARERYTDFDSVTKPLIADLMKPDVADAVRDALVESPLLADLLFTIGGTEASRADFLDACRNKPGKALRMAVLMETEIAKELGKANGKTKDGEGEGDKKGEAAPATPKPRAPKPPTEVGGRGAPGEDVLISAAKTGDFRSFEAEQTRRALASRK